MFKVNNKDTRTTPINNRNTRRRCEICSKLTINTQVQRRGQDSFKGKWDNPRATEHTLTCHGQYNWIYLKALATERL